MLLNPHRFGAPGPAPGYRYWRLDVTKWTSADVDQTATSGGAFIVPEFSIHTLADVEHPTVDMTTDSAPSPLVASASSVENGDGTDDAFTAFDGALAPGATVGWTPDSAAAAPYWVQVDMGANVDGTYCKITPVDFVNALGNGSFALRSFTVEASATGVFGGEEVTKFTVTDLAKTGWTPSTPRTFAFP